MQKKLVVTCSLLLLMSSVALAQIGGVKIKETEDSFEGSKTVVMDGNRVKIDGAAQSSLFKGILGLAKGDLKISMIKTELNLEQYHKAGKTKNLFVIVSIEIKDDARFFIDDGESLILLVDGQRMALSTKGEFNTEQNVRYSNSKTNARYAITPTQLQSIVNADSVQFRIINGGFMERKEETRDKEGNYFEGSFDQENLQAWKDFYNTYVATKS